MPLIALNQHNYEKSPEGTLDLRRFLQDQHKIFHQHLPKTVI